MLTCPHSNKTLQPGSPKLSFSKPQTNKTASFCRTWITSATPDLCGRIFSFGMIPLSSTTNGTSGACSPKATHVFKSSRSVIIRLYQQLAPIKESDSLQNVDTGRFMPEIWPGTQTGWPACGEQGGPSRSQCRRQCPTGGCHSSATLGCLGSKGQEGLAWARRGPVWPSKAPRRADTACVCSQPSQGLREGLVSFLCQHRLHL